MRNLLTRRNIIRIGILILIFVTLRPFLFPCFLIVNEGRNFQDRDLLLNENDLPSGWEFSGENILQENQGQVSGIGFSWELKLEEKKSIMNEIIYRYPCSNEAYRYFQNWSTMDEFKQQGTEIIFMEDNDLGQIKANNWDFRCKNMYSPPSTRIWSKCFYIAQYDEFMLYFGVIIQEDKNLL